jgi:hypothetical protein
MPDFYSAHYDHRLNWLALMSIRNAAVPLLLQGRVHRFLFASSHEWKAVRVEPGRTVTELDPVILPALSTERVELFPVGSGQTRVEKTERIAGLDLARRYLDVCIMEGRNCSRCPKCLRTLLTLELLGHLDAFQGVFDLQVYRQGRDRFIADVLAEDTNGFLIEIHDLMLARGFSPPPGSRVRARALRAWRRLPPAVRRRARRIMNIVARR